MDARVRNIFGMQNFHWQIGRISALNSAECRLLYVSIWDELSNLGFCVLCFCCFFLNLKNLVCLFIFCLEILIQRLFPVLENLFHFIMNENLPGNPSQK